MITASGIDLRFGAVEALSGVDLASRTQQVVGLIGPNGSGKSTLLRCLYGVLRADRGAVLVDGVAIESLSRRTLARCVSLVEQDGPGDALGVTVGEFVLLGRHVHRRDHQAYAATDHQIAGDALDRVGMGSLAHRRLDEISGGERQRVVIARCLAQQSPTMLLDEPTNHLDIRYQHDILGLVRGLDLTTIVVLHDLNLAGRYCDHLVLLERGRVVASGCPDEVLQSHVLEPVYEVEVQRLSCGHGTVLAFSRPIGGASHHDRGPRAH
jgi:iron complex transport system ATP-binding protein